MRRHGTTQRTVKRREGTTSLATSVRITESRMWEERLVVCRTTVLLRRQQVPQLKVALLHPPALLLQLTDVCLLRLSSRHHARAQHTSKHPSP